MTTEVRDNREGQKNSPKGPDAEQGSTGGGKQGALEHGHGKNESTADSVPNREKRNEGK